MSTKYKNKTCVYCAERVSSCGDHVVAREFFPDSARANLPQVPACDDCNTKKSRLEQYAMTLLPFGSDHETAKSMLDGKVQRRLQKNMKLKRELRAGMHRIQVRMSDGCLPSVLTLPIETDCIIQLFEFIVRGLVWHHWQSLIPKGYLVEVLTVSDRGLIFFTDYLLKMSPRFCIDAVLANGGFRYTCTRNDDDPAFSAWHMKFYETPSMAGNHPDGSLIRAHICALTGPPVIRSAIDKFLSL